MLVGFEKELLYISLHFYFALLEIPPSGKIFFIE